MANETIVLVGVPDTGKTNYLARVWEALRKGKGSLVCPTPPDNIKYVEDALNHMLQGSFAPRSNKNIHESRSDVVIPVKFETSTGEATADLLIPDVTGELWKKAIETMEMPAQWMDDLRKASGAVLFVRAFSDEIITPLDWITARNVLRGNIPIAKDKDGIPTQVQLCELLRFLELSLTSRPDGSPPKVAILVTAYDRLDAQTAAKGPSKYLSAEYPLFAGRLADTQRLSIKVFGASIVGGDLDVDEDFRNQFLDGDIAKFGYVVSEINGTAESIPDITLPLTWLVRGDN